MLVVEFVCMCILPPVLGVTEAPKEEEMVAYSKSEQPER